VLRKHFNGRKKIKREEAEERQVRYDALTLEEKLAGAITMGGPNSKQTVKLAKQLTTKG